MVLLDCEQMNEEKAKKAAFTTGGAAIAGGAASTIGGAGLAIAGTAVAIPPIAVIGVCALAGGAVTYGVFKAYRKLRPSDDIKS
ncbi:MAG: hypothetical protein OXD30_04045 [Bryobacterales bacterium]|nr:hypothetical protein [Bryobacterales bacterium]